MPKKENVTTEDKPKRTVLTGAAKLEAMRAQLAEAEAKERAKAEKKITAQKDVVAALEKRKADVEAKLTAAKAELESLEQIAGTAEQPELPTS
jgi:chromosome segregation ATPase